MKTLKYISLATFVLLFNCCKKSGDGYVKGTVFESGSGSTIAGVTVEIIYDKNPGSYQYQTLTSAVTDANGNYRIDYHKTGKYLYFVQVKNDDNYTSKTSQELTNKKSAVSLVAFPKAYLKLRIIKTSSTANAIRPEIKSFHDAIKLDEIYRENPYDTLIPKTFRVCGNSDNWVSWQIGPTFQHGNIYISKNDTATFTITYN